MQLKMKDVIFREYDIRGVVGTELIIDQVYDLVRAIAFYFKEQNPKVKTIAVGMDGRIHSPAIRDELCRALIDSGLDVLFVGVCPTPALYFALHTLKVDGGLMITASHNPGEYNGIKICLGKASVWGEQVQEIARAYREKKFITADQKGTQTEYMIVPDYVAWLADNFAHLKGMKRSVVIDCGNGAAGTVMPQLVKAMEWDKVELLYPEVDGTYPHHEADPTVAKNMQEVKRLLQETDMQLGAGLDGDCDRMAPMTKQGELVAGDKLLALFAQQVLAQHPGAAVVCDIKSSAGLLELLEQWGAKTVISPSGHAIIKKHMRENDALLAGELSCHFFFKDRYFGYDDGIYALLRLLEILDKSGKSLDQLLKVFPKKQSSREFRIAYNAENRAEIVRQVTKHFINKDDAGILTIDGVRATMPYGWGIMRPSNTQAVLCLRFESDTQQGLDQVKEDFIKALMPFFDDAVLRKQLT